MPKRKGMSTSTMLSWIAFIVLIIAVIVIFFAWTGLTGAANNAFLIWLVFSETIGFFMLYTAVTGSALIMVAILLVAIGAILVLFNLIMNR
ncbi:MAG: hypothetical protein WED07_11510 [Candidatus Freyarchaeum deiterrae]